MRLSLATLASGLILATSAQAAVFNSKQVKQLNGGNFKRLVNKSEKLTIAAFVAPWCGYCKKLGPEFDRAAENLKGLVNIVAVDCDEQPNKQLCGEMGVQGFPTIKVFPGGSAPPKPYNGERTAKDIVTFATSNMPTFVKRAGTAAELEALRAKAEEKPVSLLFTSAALVTPLYKALSTDLHREIEFYAARDAKVGAEAMKAFGVEKVPSLVVLTGDKVEKYSGALKYDAIKSFLQPFTESTKAKPSAHVEL